MRNESWSLSVVLLGIVVSAAPGQRINPGGALPPLPAASVVPAAPTPAAADLNPVAQDEQKLRTAGLRVDGPALVEFFRQRAQQTTDADGLNAWIRRLNDEDPAVRSRATRLLLGHGTAALPQLRRAANDLGDPELAGRVQRCIHLIEGEGTTVVPAAAARLLVQRKPDGAVEALLAYLPAAETPPLVEEVAAALTALAYPGDKPHAALLKALTDELPLRRAVAGSALAGKEHPEARPAVRKLLRDPKALVRLRVALALAEASDLDGVPVLIGLLAEVPTPQHKPIENLLLRLAGEWGPITPQGDDEVARRIRRDAWAGWWRNSDGPALLAQVRRHVLGGKDRARVLALIEKLGDDDFQVRQIASTELIEFGALAVPLLREATRSTDAERARRAEECLKDIADKGGKPLPEPVLRLLSIRRPAGAVEALLDYLPFAENEQRSEETRRALAALALREGRLEPALVRALEDPLPLRRLAAAEAILAAGALEQRDNVRKLLRDAEPLVRHRVAVALALKRDREAIPVLIESLAEEPSDASAEAEEILYRLAGDGGPKSEPGGGTAGRRQRRDSWARWWKEAGSSVDLAVLDNHAHQLGYTLLACYSNHQVLELGRDGKPRWTITGVAGPVDAVVLPGDRVLIAEYGANRVTERDFKGHVLWQKEGLNGRPVNAQRLANGNTFIALDSGLLEVDRAGKTVWSQATPHLDAAHKSRDGSITCLESSGQCIRLSAAGKELKRFPSGRTGGFTSGLDVGGGRILIAQPNENRVWELDAEGKVLWQAATPGIISATRLRNGHTLVAGNAQSSVIELDRAGKVVWEHKAGMQVFRARRR